MPPKVYHKKNWLNIIINQMDVSENYSEIFHPLKRGKN